MSKWDIEYLKLCKKILTEGKETENRTGINTIKIPSHNFQLDVGEEFPVLISKQLYFRQAVLEMLWIYQVQSNDVRWLQDRNVKIWDKWEVGEDGWYEAEQMIRNDEGKLEKSIVKRFFGKEYAHTIGTAYGYIANKFQLTQNLICTIKQNPTDRRMVMSLWQNDYLDTAVLPSCVWSSEWDVTDGKLNLWVHQRSCDVPAGLPFNVTQYATLLCMIARDCDLKPGTLDWSIKDAHIYVNQIPVIEEQLKRGENLEEFENSKEFTKPELWLNPEKKDFFSYDNSKECKDIKVKKYKHMGPLILPEVAK